MITLSETLRGYFVHGNACRKPPVITKIKPPVKLNFHGIGDRKAWD
jgi:hypothetical protein